MHRRRFFSGLSALALSLVVPGPLAAAAGDGLASRGPGAPTLPPVDNSTMSAANTIYLTFDDGYVGLNEKVAALNALGVPGTFFLTGQAILSNARTVEWLVNSGHRLGNHTHSHATLTRLSPQGIARELRGCEQAALAVTGVSTQPLLRPPAGVINQAVRQTAAALGYQSILWNWDTRDWAGTSASYIAGHIGQGIVLMHTQGRNTVAALSSVVPALAERGYVFAIL